MESEASEVPTYVGLRDGMLRLQLAKWRKTAPLQVRRFLLFFDLAHAEQFFAGFAFIVILNAFTNQGLLAHTYLLLLLAWDVRRSPLFRRRIAPPALTKLMDFPKLQAQFPVRIEIFNQNESVGKDRGLITFLGDFIHFEGEKTTFELPNSLAVFREDYTLRPAPFAADRTHGRDDFRVGWAAGDRFGRVDINVYDRNARGSEFLIKAFVSHLQDWYWQPTTNHRSCTLPPGYPDPEFIKGQVTIARRRFGFFALGLGLLAFAATHGTGFDVSACLGATVWSFVIWIAQLRRTRQIRKLATQQTIKYDWVPIGTVGRLGTP